MREAIRESRVLAGRGVSAGTNKIRTFGLSSSYMGTSTAKIGQAPGRVWPAQPTRHATPQPGRAVRVCVRVCVCVRERESVCVCVRACACLSALNNRQ